MKKIQRAALIAVLTLGTAGVATVAAPAPAEAGIIKKVVKGSVKTAALVGLVVAFKARNVVRRILD